MTKIPSDDQIIPIPCQNPDCETVIKENFGWMKSNTTLQCQDCGFENQLEDIVKGIEEMLGGEAWDRIDPDKGDTGPADGS